MPDPRILENSLIILCSSSCESFVDESERFLKRVDFKCWVVSFNEDVSFENDSETRVIWSIDFLL